MSKRQRISEMDPARDKTYFEQQRETLLGDIAMSFEHVLANINKLNRSLEAIVTVGNEFSSVEALWSQFENVMAKQEDDTTKQQGDEDKAQTHYQGDERDDDAHEQEGDDGEDSRA